MQRGWMFWTLFTSDVMRFTALVLLCISRLIQDVFKTSSWEFELHLLVCCVERYIHEWVYLIANIYLRPTFSHTPFHSKWQWSQNLTDMKMYFYIRCGQGVKQRSEIFKIWLDVSQISSWRRKWSRKDLKDLSTLSSLKKLDQEWSLWRLEQPRNCLSREGTGWKGWGLVLV